MQKTFAFFLFLLALTACATVYSENKENPPEAIHIPGNYQPKNVKTDATRKKLVREGEALIGTPYKYGGTTPAGFDCSGFTGFVYDKISMDITRSSSSQAKKGKKIDLSEVLPGDLLFFTGTGKKKISHVAMIVSNNGKGITVVHSTSSRGVRKDNITHSTYWKPKILFARRILK